MKPYVKALSHWRRRRRDYRDWLVAATRATRETKNSLRSHQSGDVAATAPCLYIPRSTTRSIIRWCQHTLSHVITKVGQTASSSVAEKSPQRLLSLQQVSERSRRRLLSLQQVSERSRRRLRDLLETERSLQENWTCLIFPRLPGDPACLQETSRRRLRD